MDTSEFFKIGSINWKSFEKNSKIRKCTIEINLDNPVKFLSNVDECTKNIFYSSVLPNVKFDSSKTRVGLCFVIPCLNYPINVEYCKIQDIDDKLDTVNERFTKVSQSSKLSEIAHLQIIFTLIKVEMS